MSNRVERDSVYNLIKKCKRLQVESFRMMSNRGEFVEYCRTLVDVDFLCLSYVFYVETSTQAKKIITFYRKGIDSAIRFKDTR